MLFYEKEIARLLAGMCDFFFLFDEHVNLEIGFLFYGSFICSYK